MGVVVGVVVLWVWWCCGCGGGAVGVVVGEVVLWVW